MASIHFIVYLLLPASVLAALIVPVTDSVRAAACSSEVEAGCMEGVDRSTMEKPKPEDLGAICGIYTCIKSKNCEPSTAYASFEAMCGGSDGVCSAVQMAPCMAGIDQSMFTQDNAKPDPDTLKKMCGFITCVAKLKCKLSKDMEGFTEMKDYCPDANDGTNGGGCDLAKVMGCVQGVQNLAALNGSMEDFNEDLCEKLTEAVDCVTQNMKGCPTSGEAMEGIKTMESFGKCCNKLVAVKDKCYTADLEFKDESLLTCKQKEAAFSCLMINGPKCPGDVEKMMGNVKKEGRQAMEECRDKGYNITVSLLTGKPLNGAGITVLPSASVVFGLMLAMAAWWF